jgi:hypothetical protein
MTQTLYIDLDSTCWPAERRYAEVEKELYGTDIFCTKYWGADEWEEVCGEPIEVLLMNALNPADIPNRELYDGCAEVLCSLYHGIAGEPLNLYFVSHSYFAKNTRDPLYDWLEDKMHSGVEFELKVYHSRFRKENTMLKDPTAFALLDDMPRNVEGAVDAGFPVFVKRQKWNKLLEGTEGAYFFDSWYELPEMINNQLGVYA